MKDALKSLFPDNDSAVVELPGADAAALLERVPSSRVPLEAKLKQRLQGALVKGGRKQFLAFLRRYRFWDPIYVHGRVFPTDHLELEKRVPLGFVCKGVAEIIDPITIDMQLATGWEHVVPTERLAKGALRDRNRKDQLEDILFPGSPISLFEASDSLFGRAIEQPMGVVHKGYAVFAGSRAIQPCISSERSDVIRKWIAARSDWDFDQMKAGAVKLGLDINSFKKKLISLASTKETPDVTSPEAMVRLLLSSMFPTPWSTHILYFSNRFVESLSASDQQLVIANAWQRMSSTFERFAIAAERRSGVDLVCAEVIDTAKAALNGIDHCLVPADQCPEVTEDTGLIKLHSRYCHESKLYEDHPPPLLVPGFIRNPGDWGLIPLRPYAPETTADAEALYERIADATRRDLVNSGSIHFLQYIGQLGSANLPRSVVRAFEREENGKRLRNKFLWPSLALRRCL